MDRSRSIQANSGTAVSAIISPVPIAHSTSFLRQNRLSLTQQQADNRTRREAQLVSASRQPFKMERFKHVGSAIMADVDRRREEVRGKERKFLKKNEGKSVVKRGANASVGDRLEEYQRTDRRMGGDQADEADEAEDMFDDALADEMQKEADQYEYSSSAGVRHSGLGLRLQREQEEKTAITTSSQYSPSPSASPLYSARSYTSSASASARSTPKSFIAANALSVIHTLPPAPAPPAPTSSLLHSSFGRTPAYLLARKEEAEERKRREAEERRARAVPAGMRRVEEDERQATLARLREEGAAVERAVMALPLRCETVSRRRHKDELERKMQDIEEAITLFSKKIVYITL